MALAEEARELVHLIRRIGRTVSGKERLYRAAYHCPKMRLGNFNASFTVNPKLLNAKSVLYSAGVGTDISFDLESIEMFALQVHAFDPTPRSVQWIAAQEIPTEFQFHAYGLAGNDGTLPFYPPENQAHVSYSSTRHVGAPVDCPVRKLSTIMRELGHTQIDLLKMDIEGAEYEVIDSMIAEQVLPTQFCVEFHHRWQHIGSGRTDIAIEKLLGLGYRIFDVAASGEEFSFIRV